MEEEIFKLHKQLINYKIGNKGSVISLHTGKFLKGKVDKDGYIEHHLRDPNKPKSKNHIYRRAHRLVAETFLENLHDYPVVNHKNNVKDDNRVENLEWCTVKYNTQYSFDHHNRKGQNGGMNKPVILYDLNWNPIKEFDSCRAAAKYIDINANTYLISNYLKRAETLGDEASIRFKFKAKLL